MANIRVCPNCGGQAIIESDSWKCWGCLTAGSVVAGRLLWTIEEREN